MINQDRIKELFDYNCLTGELTWKIVNNKRNKNEGNIAGCIHQGYIRIKIDGKRYFAHTLIWIYMTGEHPEYIDHIDHDRSNNVFSNLREATKRGNARNKRLDGKRNRIGIFGVALVNGNSWIARISNDNKRVNLGTYDNLFDACCARKSAEIKYKYHINHGGVF